MEFFSKAFLYDWGGGNVWLFKQINSLSGDMYDTTMILLSKIADHHHFPYYLAGLLAFAVLSYLFKKLTHRGGTRYLVSAWFGVFLVLCAGYVVEGQIIHYAKDYFSYPRPYAALPEGDVRVLEVRPADDNYHSFPSGHAAFITMMVVGLWPVLAGKLKWLGFFLILGVCWSRMALGVHFPADTLTSMVFVFPLMLILRGIIYWIMLRLFRVKC